MQRADLASSFPGTAAIVARYDLAGKLGGKPDIESDKLARDALQATPLAEPALAWLAFSPLAPSGANVRLARLVGRLGWRDSFVQRQLYNAALQRGAFNIAMMHVDAIMRLPDPNGDLADRLVAGANVAQIRAFMLPRVSSSSPWAKTWLLHHSAQLSDDALLQFATAQSESDGTLRRDFADQWSAVLVGANRPFVAFAIAARAPGGSTTLPMTLAWPEADLGPATPPFEWHLGEGYSIEAGVTRRLTAYQVTHSATSYRLFALPPGDYVLTSSDPATTVSDWRWEIGCGAHPQTVDLPLEQSNAFSVDEDCPLQWIALGARDDAEPLGALKIEQAQ